MIIDLNVLGEFGSQVRRERKVGILDGDLCRSLFRYQAGYIGSTSSREELGDASELSDATCTTKVLLLGSSATAANFFLPTSSTRLRGLRESFLGGICLPPELSI